MRQRFLRPVGGDDTCILWARPAGCPYLAHSIGGQAARATILGLTTALAFERVKSGGRYGLGGKYGHVHFRNSAIVTKPGFGVLGRRGQKRLSERGEKWGTAKTRARKFSLGVGCGQNWVGRKKIVDCMDPLSDDFLPTFNLATYHQFLSESTTESNNQSRCRYVCLVFD